MGEAAASEPAGLDEKRHEFKMYLQNAGVTDAVTQALVRLYEEREKPADPLEYVRKTIGDPRPTAAEMQQAKEALEMATAALHELIEENHSLTTRLAELDPEHQALGQPREWEEQPPAAEEAPAE